MGSISGGFADTSRTALGPACMIPLKSQAETALSYQMVKLAAARNHG
jgi:hypothetical protein